MTPKLQLAYITTTYPALSHTFIEREVSALRRHGVEVHTISLRRTAGAHLLSQRNRDASESTYAVRPARWRDLLASHWAALVAHPHAYFITLFEACRLARPGLRGRLWQVFYFGEAILVWHHCSGLGVTHLHAHHASAPADVALLAAHFGRAAGGGPATWSLTMHGPVEFADVRWFGLVGKIDRADAVVCISDFARSQLMALTDPGRWDRLSVVHCGVVPSKAEHVTRPAQARPQVLCVGRLVPEKGHAVLLKAIALLARDGVDVEAVLVGDGPLRGGLETLAGELGIADRVAFLGALGQEDLARCYAGATVFCSPSFAEGVPVVLMEAMASELPVVATAIAGVRELVRDKETGILVTPGRVDELAGAIATLLRTSSLRARLGRAGRQHVARDFDVNRSAARLTELFADLPRSRKRSPEVSSFGSGSVTSTLADGVSPCDIAAPATSSATEGSDRGVLSGHST
jgi:colanic acid/amylovoran biosynthesis glycosyltransferase